MFTFVHVFLIEKIFVYVPMERVRDVVPSMPLKDRSFSLSKRGLVALCGSDDIKMPLTWFLMKASSTYFISTQREELSWFFCPVYSQGNTTALSDSALLPDQSNFPACHA